MYTSVLRKLLALQCQRSEVFPQKPGPVHTVDSSSPLCANVLEAVCVSRSVAEKAEASGMLAEKFALFSLGSARNVRAS